MQTPLSDFEIRLSNSVTDLQICNLVSTVAIFLFDSPKRGGSCDSNFSKQFWSRAEMLYLIGC